jgi:hypothetical protein
MYQFSPPTLSRRDFIITFQRAKPTCEPTRTKNDLAGAMLLRSAKGFWDGKGFTDDAKKAVRYPDGPSCVEASESLTAKGIRAWPYSVSGAAKAGAVKAAPQPEAA